MARSFRIATTRRPVLIWRPASASLHVPSPGYLRPPASGRRPPREPLHRRFRGRQREPGRARPGRAH
eukprot:6671558-Alexandrium_andersonii.AAC.1